MASKIQHCLQSTLIGLTTTRSRGAISMVFFQSYHFFLVLYHVHGPQFPLQKSYLVPYPYFLELILQFIATVWLAVRSVLFKWRNSDSMTFFTDVYQPTIPGMPFTTPINLPGLPPITVSATMPYNTLAGYPGQPEQNNYPMGVHGTQWNSKWLLPHLTRSVIFLFFIFYFILFFLNYIFQTSFTWWQVWNYAVVGARRQKH